MGRLDNLPWYNPKEPVMDTTIQLPVTENPINQWGDKYVSRLLWVVTCLREFEKGFEPVVRQNLLLR